jgi:hypothetical protein
MIKGIHSAAFCSPTYNKNPYMLSAKHSGAQIIYFSYFFATRRQKDVTFRLRNAKHDRLDFELRSTTHDRSKIDSKYTCEFSAQIGTHISQYQKGILREEELNALRETIST